MRPWAATLAVVGALAGCTTTDPLPEVAYGSDEEVLAILEDRTSGARSLYAVLAMGFDGPEHQGAFDTVVSWEAPRRMRVTAFKDLVLSDRDIFDLILTPDGYVAVHQFQEAEPPETQRGPLVSFPRDLPGFSGFYWSAEALFLPGVLGPREHTRVLERGPKGVSVETQLTSGALVRWALAPDTLEVRSAVVVVGDRQIRLEYADYRKERSTTIPGWVRLRDPAQKLLITCTLKDLELNPELDPAVFQLGPR